MAGLVTQRIRPSVQGVDLDNSPEYVGDLYGSRVINLLTRGGALQMRGGLEYINDYVFGSSNNNDLLKGLMVFDDNFLVTIDVGGTEHYNLLTNTSTNIADVPIIQSKRYARVGAFVYGSGRAAGGASDQLLRWPGGAVAPTALAIGTAPVNTIDCCEHLQRLFVLGGNIGGGAGGVSSIMWTDPDGTTGAGVLADWQDNTTGLTNQIAIGAIDNDIAIGLGKIDRSLAVFKKRSIYVLSGQTPATFQVRRFSDQIGCVSRDTICSYNDGCYFMSDRGLMYFDGSQLVEVSKPVRSALQLALRQVVVLGNPYYTVSDMGSGCLLVVVGAAGGTPGATTYSAIDPKFQCMYDTVRDTWVELSFVPTGTAGAIASETALTLYNFKPQVCFWGNNRAVMSDAFQFTYADNVNAPRANVAAAGKDMLSTPTGAGSSTILAEWVSRSFKLASPPNKSQLHRVFLDYDHNSSSGTQGWRVYVVPTNLTVAFALLTAATATNLGAADVRTRAVLDTFSEAEEVQLKVNWPSAVAPPTCIAKIFDAYLEYQPAAHRTG